MRKLIEILAPVVISAAGMAGLTFVSVGALETVAAVVAPVAAHADPVEDTPGGVYVRRISPAPAGPAITVTLSNGHRAELTPCVYEDGRRCYWQADRRGNGIGRDYVVTAGTLFTVDLSWIGTAR